ncbi:hypothetical protein CAPTEDRAFT_219407 [Capitella teleta]|uniref:Transmembrane protein 45B n=1 Tax=Capitella teleta TaxID=283909 RepID=R7V4Q6_CAPTE|nr:hypothetical protein CAPTEDRAFT_219407 [Capitella teleta]|eukprot:ELU10750.1 hypothetical protein CAPTEDRAFT_219407 [Capitella teleta]
MGSFVGHALPGTFFILFGVWWTVRIFIRYFESLTRRGEPYSSSVTYPPRLKRFPNVNLEALMVTIGAGLGIFVEIVAACFMRGKPLGVTNEQHATMYFFFGLAGFVCLTIPFYRGALPALDGDLQFITLLLAFAAESLLFKFHLIGRDGIDILVHTLLLYACYACVLSTGLEMAYRTNMLASLARAFFTIVQGTWFWQTAFLLYSPFNGEAWGSKTGGHDHGGGGGKEGGMHGGGGGEHIDHQRYMTITLIFAWHVAVVFLLTLVTGALIGCRYRRQVDTHKVRLQTSFASPPCNGYAVMQNGAADDDDEL